MVDEHSPTPLHIAATNGLEGIVFDLGIQGADKDAQDVRGESQLMRAAQHGHAAKTLLASGANHKIRRTGHSTCSARLGSKQGPLLSSRSHSR